jgi:6-pyruvoyltetrahydropterin/6-carboxytetrahydropterin synthase
MFEVQKSAEFAAAHSLRDYDGPCARNHGHNYRVEVVVRGRRLDDRRMIIDFHSIDEILAPVVRRIDHRNLNEIPPFDTVNPTAEAIAAWFFGELRDAVAERTGGTGYLAAVRLWETPDSCATYSEEPSPAPPGS